MMLALAENGCSASVQGGFMSNDDVSTDLSKLPC